MPDLDVKENRKGLVLFSDFKYTRSLDTNLHTMTEIIANISATSRRSRCWQYISANFSCRDISNILGNPLGEANPAKLP